MDPIAPGNHDRAWNDPPKFAYNAGSSGGQGGVAGRRRLLNKRVPVPIGQAPPTQPTAAPIMRSIDTPPTKGSLPPRGPPPTTIAVPPRCSSTTHTTTNNTDSAETTQSSQEMMQEVDIKLNLILMTLAGSMKESVREVIVQKIALMTDMWKGNNFNQVVQKRILALAKALAGGEYDTAWALHQGLIVDYTSLCSAWMVGVKTLISEARQSKKAEEEKTDKPKEENILGVTEEGEMDDNKKEEITGKNEVKVGSNETAKHSYEEVCDPSSRIQTEEPDQVPMSDLKVSEDTSTERS